MTHPSTPVLAPFPARRAHELAERPPEQAWLVEGLWAEAGVGAIGGCPKSSKSWLALDLAVSVASATPCLGAFAVPRPGPVLLFAAEDPLVTVRERLEGIAATRALELAALPIHVITVALMQLDTPEHQERLRATVASVQPRLLIIDPLVRVYGRIDENSAAEMSALLAYLRGLQREFDMAVLIVHHARKAQTSDAAVGQALRGSGDLHAWVDSLLYLKRTAEGVRLSVEHRSAAAPEPILLELACGSGEPPHLRVVRGRALGEPNGLGERVLSLLTRSPAGLTLEEMRHPLRVRKQTLVACLGALESAGRVSRQERGWCVMADPGGTHPRPSDALPRQATLLSI